MEPVESEGRWGSIRKCLVFNGEYYYKNDGGYFVKRRPQKILHREVWKLHNGEIPKGFVVHHIDHNKENNKIENLEIMGWSEHNSLHARSNKYFGSEANLSHLQRIRKTTWKKKLRTPSLCVLCGSEFMTLQPERAKFCSRSCKNVQAGRDYRERQRELLLL